MFVRFSALNLHKMSIRRGIVGLEQPTAEVESREHHIAIRSVMERFVRDWLEVVA